MSRRTVLLVVAGILALGAGLLTFNFLNTAGKQSAQAAPRAVLVAAQPIAANTSITTAMVQVAMRPSDAVDPGTLSSPDQINGVEALGPIPAGAALTASNTGHADNLVSAAVQLEPGMRALSIPVDEVKDVSGLVHPGDRVDVIASPPRVNNAPPRAYTILRNVEVMAVGGATRVIAQASPAPGQPVQAPVVVRTVTLEVSPDQSDLLTAADLNAVLRLALRSPREHSNLMTEAMYYPAPETGGSGGPAPAAPASGKSTSHRPQMTISPVVVIDGDRVDDGTTEK